MFDLWFSPSDELTNALLSWIADILHDQPLETFTQSDLMYQRILKSITDMLTNKTNMNNMDQTYFEFIHLLNKEVQHCADTLNFNGSFTLIRINELTATKISMTLEIANDNNRING